MARMTFKAGNEYALKLSRLAAGQEEIASKAIYAGAKIVADKIRENLRKVTSDEATGDLENSLGITPLGTDRDGNYNRKVGFDGYDRKGVPNALKARAKESGTSRQKKTPFVRPAVNATKKQAEAVMGRIIEEETKKIMRG